MTPRSTRKLTADIVDQICKDYGSGISSVALAKKYNLSRVSICKALKMNGIEPRRRDNLFVFQPAPTGKDLGSNIATDYVERGLFITELSEKYKKPKFAILRHLAIMEVKNQHPVLSRVDLNNKISSDIVDQLCIDYKAGNGHVTIYDLARKHIIHPAAINYWLKKRGLLDDSEGDTLDRPELRSYELKKLIRGHSGEYFEVLHSIAMDEESTNRDRMSAISLLYDRAYGLSKEETEEEQKETNQTKRILNSIPNELKERILPSIANINSTNNIATKIVSTVEDE